ncbi:hypothetical protein C8J55DRAFT_514895 [Lentinula edodes]|uniref:Uncharacterized protein n=1 Tax=Lentinula lateritia TaxID=40482 RepID=A0A9W9DNE6_9AGAR|nr:hypothetical protein C8J55DRAFT_514895 [Lentinula edodes]
MTYCDKLPLPYLLGFMLILYSPCKGVFTIYRLLCCEINYAVVNSQESVDNIYFEHAQRTIDLFGYDLIWFLPV